jgi:DNA (cytosine-5)-methyltransferase 1
MTQAKPTFVSLFSGAGGLDIGLELAGFRGVTAVECDPDCVRTLEQNQREHHRIPGGGCHLSGTRILARSVEDLTGSDLCPPGVKSPWVPDLMAGGPPCQPFSSSGRMLSLDDPRGRLFEHFVRLAGEVKPRLILFENVRGLVTARGPQGEPGEVLHRVKEAFEKLGYATTFQLLNAADYGVPQRRVRCFMMATRDTDLPVFPAPTHAEVAEQTLFATRLPWVTLGDFLRDQPKPGPNEIVRPSEALARELAALQPGTGLKSPGARETTRPGGHWGYRQGTFIADPNLPARTVTASTSQDWIRLPDGSLRRLTLRECAGLQGFPRDWTFSGSSASRFRQVGNAVPVQFGVILGQALLDALRTEPLGRVKSAPLPEEFHAAINYTRKELRRNGESRKRVIALQQAGHADRTALKGTGSASELDARRS